MNNPQNSEVAKAESKASAPILKKKLTPKLKSFLILPLWLISVSSNAFAVSYEELISQPNRPAVPEVLSLLETWSLPELKDEREFPKDPTRPAPDLQYNYPTWYSEFEREAPKMIATFEQAFPGATWAFIGRDMAALADVFEAFYRALGQEDRVVRIGMSTATLTNLTEQGAIEILKQAGLDCDHLLERKHPFILVDTVSRGIARQARALLNAAFNYHYKITRTAGYESLHAAEKITQSDPQGRSSKGKAKLKTSTFPESELLFTLNFIGLKVATTPIPGYEVNKAFLLLGTQFQNEVAKIFLRKGVPEQALFIYEAELGANDYLSVNEGGYAHWVGAWHGPYGPTQNKDGTILLPPPGPLSKRPIRESVLTFQGHLVKLAQSPSFFREILRNARDLGYEFPRTRPLQVNHPSHRLLLDLSLLPAKGTRGRKLKNSKNDFNLDSIIALLAEAKKYNLAREHLPSSAIDSIVSLINQTFSTSARSLDQDLESILNLHRDYQEISIFTYDQSSLSFFEHFFDRRPTIDQMIKISEYVRHLKTNAYSHMVTLAIRYITDLEMSSTEAKEAVKMLGKPTDLAGERKTKYKLAKKLFKKKHGKWWQRLLY